MLLMHYLVTSTYLLYLLYLQHLQYLPSIPLDTSTVQVIMVFSPAGGAACESVKPQGGGGGGPGMRFMV